MDSPRDPVLSPRDPLLEEIEDQERLEQFLAWRRTLERRRPGVRGLGWRWFTYGVGAGVLGTIFVALASLLAGDLGVARRLGGHSSSVPIEPLAETSRSDQPDASVVGLGAAGDAGTDRPTDREASPRAVVAHEPGEDSAGSRRPSSEPARAQAPDAGSPAASSTSPSLSLPERPSRGARRPAAAATLGGPPDPAALPRPSLPTLEDRSVQPDVPAAPPVPTPAPVPASSPVPAPSPRPTSSVDPAPAIPSAATPAPAASADSAPARSHERVDRVPPTDGAAPSANAASPSAASAASNASAAGPGPAAAPPPEVAEKPFPEPIETLKRLVDSVADGKAAKSIRRWVTPNREPEATGATRSR